jgi:hypothetical protein
MSGTATADEIKRGLRTEKERSLWRITVSPGVGSLLAVGLFVRMGPSTVWRSVKGFAG